MLVFLAPFYKNFTQICIYTQCIFFQRQCQIYFSNPKAKFILNPKVKFKTHSKHIFSKLNEKLFKHKAKK